VTDGLPTTAVSQCARLSVPMVAALAPTIAPVSLAGKDPYARKACAPHASMGCALLLRLVNASMAMKEATAIRLCLIRHVCMDTRLAWTHAPVTPAGLAEPVKFHTAPAGVAMGIAWMQMSASAKLDIQAAAPLLNATLLMSRC
jgi:hypothetical protein